MTMQREPNSCQPTKTDGEAPASGPDTVGDDVVETQLLPRRRRANRALHDLGISALVGRGWISIVDGRFHFADLDADTFRRLVLRLEDLAGGPLSVEPPPRLTPADPFAPGEPTYTQGELFDLPNKPAVLTSDGWW